jgi:hypothetical protein
LHPGFAGPGLDPPSGAKALPKGQLPSLRRFCEETGSPADLKIQCLVHVGSNPAKTTIAESFILGLKRARVVYRLLDTSSMTVKLYVISFKLWRYFNRQWLLSIRSWVPTKGIRLKKTLVPNRPPALPARRAQRQGVSRAQSRGTRLPNGRPSFGGCPGNHFPAQSKLVCSNNGTQVESTQVVQI